MQKLFFHHPLFGLKHIGSRLSAKSQCEFCWLAIVAINTAKIEKLSTPIYSGSSVTYSKDVFSVDLGNFQVEMTCQYQPNINSRCPKVVRRAETMMRNIAIQKGGKINSVLEHTDMR